MRSAETMQLSVQEQTSIVHLNDIVYHPKTIFHLKAFQ